MSLILKGIDLPSKPTQIKIYPNGIIFCANEDGMYVPKYQAIQIPKGHGRLIDGDGLKAKREWMIWRENNSTHTAEFVNSKYIDNAPTILEPEDECERCKHKGDEYWCRDAYKDDEGKCSIYEPYGGIE